MLLTFKGLDIYLYINERSYRALSYFFWLLHELNIVSDTVHRKKPTIVTREEWGAVPPKSSEPAEIPLHRVFMTMYTETPPCLTREECIRTVKDMQTRHMEELGLSDIKFK